MRRFRDDRGTQWTAALWCGSYGEVLLIFSSSGDSAVFSAAFEADSLAAAEVLLLELGEAELRERLASADAWAGGRD